MPRWSAWIVVITVPGFLVAVVLLAVSGTQAWHALAAVGYAASQYPTALRSLRLRDPSVTTQGEVVTIRHGALRRPLTIERDELHSIVPVWLGGSGQWQVRPAAPVVPRQPVPLIGVPKGRTRPALVFVLRAERRVAGRRRPLRGVILAVEDLDVAQRAFQPWGLLARLTPGAFDWLHPKSSSSSPGPAPVYGT